MTIVVCGISNIFLFLSFVFFFFFWGGGGGGGAGRRVEFNGHRSMLKVQHF